MVTLQIIIVNYNVRYFLEQCLYSLLQATRDLDTEIWVVDNASDDDSVEMVRRSFPQVHLIENKENVGFSKANNQAIRAGKSDYVLLLNPDTVVREDTISSSIDFMESHPRCGASGIRMIDGTGEFLPESKRGLPTPWVAFCKMLKLHKIFPGVKAFDGYYLGYLDETENHEVEVLAGAYMMLRRSVLDQVGLLDEAFFMYGEDIDLSYRIARSGHQVWYLAESSIIHYKGESTKKGSLNYIVTFYKAMILFVRKHFKGQKAAVYQFFLRLAIVAHGLFSFVKYKLLRYLLPLLDIALIYGGLYVITHWWELHRFETAEYYDPSHFYLNLPIYTAIWVLMLWLSGAYDKEKNILSLIKGTVIGLFLIFGVYSLMGETFRNSRMIILLGFVYTAFATVFLRSVFQRWTQGTWSLSAKKNKRTIIVGQKSETTRVKQLLEEMNKRPDRWITLDVDHPDSWDELEERAKMHRVDEIIFCASGIAMSRIFNAMSRMGRNIEYRIVSEDSSAIVGSPSRNARAELYALELSLRIDETVQRRNKWLFDRLSSVVILIISPIYILFSQDRRKFFGRLWSVLSGRKTWVSYNEDDPQYEDLPSLRQGVFHPAMIAQKANPKLYQAYNMNYARDYDWNMDLEIVWKNL